MIKYYPLDQICRSYQEEIMTQISDVIESGQYILGERLKRFEANYASYLGTRYTVGVSNGLDALRLSIRSLNLPQHSKIGVPTHTYIATWLAVIQEGHEIVPLEVDLETLNIDVDALTEEKLLSLSAIILVHMHGSPVDLNAVASVVDGRGIKVIHDAAQAHGAEYSGFKIGNKNLIGDCVCWSFYPGKNLGAFGDAGAITTSHANIRNSLIKLRNYGSDVQYRHDEVGFNCRLDEIQAAILNVRLKYLDKETQIRIKQAKMYKEALKGHVQFQEILPNAKSCYHHFIIRSKERNRIVSAMKENKIQFGIHYPIPCHKQSVIRGRFESKNSEEISNTTLSLPLGTHLDDEKIWRVTEAISSALRNV